MNNQSFPNPDTTDTKTLSDHRPSLISSKEISRAIASFAFKQKILLAVFCLILVVSSLVYLYRLSNSFTVDIPIAGGTLTENIIGSPQLINPLLANSDADRDVVTLIYAGLMKLGPDGQLQPELAESYTVSTDGLTYTFKLRDGLRWHDGQKLTVADIIFTIKQAQDPSIKSNRRASWEGVEVSATNDRQIIFKLKKPYGAFLENTTLGILPEHLWGNISNESFAFNPLNSQPVGAGPFKISTCDKDPKSGLIKKCQFIPFADYALGQAKLQKIELRFFPDEQTALQATTDNEAIAISSISPAQAKKYTERANQKIISASLPRTFAVFFNQNQAPIFSQSEVRQALNLSVNRQHIIETVLLGYGDAISGPLPISYQPASPSPESNTDQAIELLTKAGWKKNNQGLWQKSIKGKTTTLSFVLSTARLPEIETVAKSLQADWSKIGIAVTIKPLESNELTTTVIKPRKYEALLFGQSVGRQPDLYSFWHSSQRLDPGLNIAQYANLTADKLMEEVRALNDQQTIREKNLAIADKISADQPASFLYSPRFIYVLPQNIKTLGLTGISLPSERWAQIHLWYSQSERVWKFLIPKTDLIYLDKNIWSQRPN